MDKKVLIWSNEHKAFWMPDARGYTGDKMYAGLYTREVAERYVRMASPGYEEIRAFYDLMFPTIRALSWKQPYGSMMFHGKIETRTWDTKYRGYVLICASKIPYSLSALKGISGNKQINRMFDRIALSNAPKAVALGVAELVNCRPMQPADEEACFVEYHPDLWCHEYRNARHFKVPIPWKGKQGWKTLKGEEIYQVLEALQ